MHALSRPMLACGVAVTWLVCHPLTSSSSRCAADQPRPHRMIVMPAELVVLPDYPARFIVLEDNGEYLLDRTRDANLVVGFHGLDGVSLDAQSHEACTVRVESPASGTGHLTVRLGDMIEELPVRVAADASQSPIFPREVVAVFGKAGCNLGTCHGNLHGKAGYRLSLRGDDPLLDYATTVRGQGGRRVDRFEPEGSLLLRKPLGSVAHQGGVRFAPDSKEARILRQWIEQGCQWNASTSAPVPEATEPPRPDETLVSLAVYPQQVILGRSSRKQQLVVRATFGDGTVRDVTDFARYEPSVVSGIEVSATGLVSAQGPVDVSISVSYLTGRAASRLTFLAHDHATWLEPSPPTRIDELIDAQLKRFQIQPAAAADDFVWIRRAYLAIVGRLPTEAEVLAFVTSPESDKELRAIDRLLQDPGYALAWSMRWSDLLRNEQKVMSDKGAELWHAWMTEQIANDRPLDEFVAEMLTTLGSTYEHPAASFHRTHRDPESAAESIGQVFLGVRLQCARCHNHPFDKWRQDDYYGLAAYFTSLQRQQINNEPKDKFDKHIISGDEVISLKKDVRSTIWHPGRAAEVSPKPLMQGHLPDPSPTAQTGTQPAGDGEASDSPLETLADWLTRGNRLFARNMANRIWFHYMGVGIVDPPDDFRDSNPASNPELLEYLTDELIRSGYSTRYVARAILTSRAFRRNSASEPSAEEPLGGARAFSGYPLRRMPAEVLYDALSDVTLVYRAPDESTKTVHQSRATARVSVPTKAGFLSTFGKPGRLLVCECERSSEVSLGQSLVLVNGIETREKLAAQGNRIDQLIDSGAKDNQAIESLYLTALARQPRKEELERLMDYVASSKDRRAALEDVLWVLINSKEFSLIR